jgi:allantoinase
VTPALDLAVTGATAPDGVPVDIGVGDGRVASLQPAGTLDPGSAREIVDGHGLCALPGVVDPHVHFNEPGPRTDWEGWATGSAALAAGGVTTALEMPLNAIPPTTTVTAFEAKLAAASAVSRVDFGLWGGIVPGNRDALPELAQRGVVAFKAFMSSSGTPDFGRADDLTLYEAMAVVAGLPRARLVAVHAESETITHGLAQRARAAGRVAVRDYLASRPAIAETEAITRAIELATASDCPLHIVHVSTGRGVALVAQARARGVDVTCEVTPHHLLLTEADAERLGAIAKCAPPLRDESQCAALWDGLARGDVAFVASDHSPCPPALRTGDAFSAWGGIAGCQSNLELMLTHGPSAGLGVATLADRLAGAAASRFGLSDKGSLTVGADADIVLVRRQETRVLDGEELRYRHTQSPYIGRTLSARVRRTILRGATVYADGQLVGEPRGRLV